MPGGVHPPIEVIASWPRANFVNPETHSKAYTVIASILGPLALICVVARVWARAYIQKKPGLDDWLILASLVCGLAWFCG